MKSKQDIETKIKRLNVLIEKNKEMLKSHNYETNSETDKICEDLFVLGHKINILEWVLE